MAFAAWLRTLIVPPTPLLVAANLMVKPKNGRCGVYALWGGDAFVCLRPIFKRVCEALRRAGGRSSLPARCEPDAWPGQRSCCQVIPLAEAVLSRRRPVPSEPITKVPSAEVAANAIFFPSGDQIGAAQPSTQQGEW
jgi:hypothetical protein